MKIAIIINKPWEAAPCVAAVTSRVVSRDLKCRIEICEYDAPKPLEIIRGAIDAHELRMYCLADNTPRDKSSVTSAKVEVLVRIRREYAPDVVVAVGTGGGAQSADVPGTVIVGGTSFAYSPASRDGWDQPPGAWEWEAAETEPAFSSPLDAAGIQDLFMDWPGLGRRPQMVSDPMATAVSVVNVVNAADYFWADCEALDAFRRMNPRREPLVVETTIEVIRTVMAPCKFAFVAGVLNRVGVMRSDLAWHKEAKRIAVSFNIGTALSFLLHHLAIEGAGTEER